MLSRNIILHSLRKSRALVKCHDNRSFLGPIEPPIAIDKNLPLRKYLYVQYFPLSRDRLIFFPPFFTPFVFARTGANASGSKLGCCEIFFTCEPNGIARKEIPERRRRQRARWINHAPPTELYSRNFDDPANIAEIMGTRSYTQRWGCQRGWNSIFRSLMWWKKKKKEVHTRYRVANYKSPASVRPWMDAAR